MPRRSQSFRALTTEPRGSPEHDIKLLWPLAGLFFSYQRFTVWRSFAKMAIHLAWERVYAISIRETAPVSMGYASRHRKRVG
jgi:hypothetical protein